eukprot:TRINITY_DN11525_c0_g1_i3.p1 TRINITY_DN11525_c0_g1~~TRINITY_DN11525_c0_g1_i3.p1  ORF type:complete len:148 (-),score=42.75 TRINITY_DN11525_c0_g1_i3:199-642(-)
MESNKKLDSSNKEKKLKRKEVLEKKKAVDEAVKAASAIKDHLASFPPFCQYDRNGLFVYLESGSGEQLSSAMKRYIQDLLKNHMGAVMLTVQKRNVLAMRFYTSKLRYTISTISPSRVDPLLGVEKSYEILCKAFDHEAKAKLEDNS